MIRVNDIVLAVADQVVEPRWPIDLGSLLLVPQVTQPDRLGLSPPATPPFRYEFAPGTLFWPTGASRFALGQYVATDAEIQAIRALVDDDPRANPLTLTLAGQTKEDDGLDFQMHFLHALPLQLHYADRSTFSPRPFQDAIYLLLLVDYRYYFQTDQPEWEIDDATTWDDLDDLLEDYLGDATIDGNPLAAFALQPGLLLQTPAVVGGMAYPTAGALLDAICLASGRRFVANRNGSFHIQHGVTARSILTSQALCFQSTRYGGDLAFHDLAATVYGFVAPRTITVVFPGSDGSDEVAPYTSTVALTTPLDTLWPTGALQFVEGDLRVVTTAYNDGTNDADCDNFAEAWANEWWGWLAQPEIIVYSGVVPFEPVAALDYVRWVTRKDDVYTYTTRGLLNPRPGLVHVYSGVDAPSGGSGSTITVEGVDDTEPPETADPVTLTGIGSLAFDVTYLWVEEDPSGTAVVHVREAKSGQGGVLTTGAQTIDGLKTFTDGLAVGDGTPAVAFDHATAGVAGSITLIDAGVGGGRMVIAAAGSGGLNTSFRVEAAGVITALLDTGELIILNTTGLTLDTGQVYAVGSDQGVTGSNLAGDTFVGGICTGFGS